MDNWTFFSGRSLVVATQHGKERVIEPCLKEAFGVHAFVIDQLNTDSLGTFSGEVERIASPLETAQKKCHMAMDISGVDLSIASEGSFGPHPSIPFIPAHEELLLLIDKKNAWEFVVRKLETKTNYGQISIQSLDELEGFLEQSLFPSHGLIVKQSADDANGCVKGIHDLDVLLDTLVSFLKKQGHCCVETDMRAMHNPSRMKVIEDLTLELIQQIQCTCPQCQTPGFRITDVLRGLPCALCARPTRRVKSEIFACQTCHYTELRAPGHALTAEDPMYCDFCNP